DVVSMLPDGGNEAARWLEGREREMEAALTELVEINSFTENAEGGRKVGQILRGQVFSIDGLGARLHASDRFADHLVFTSKVNAGVRPVALIGHLDTVFPPGVFEGYVKDGDLRRGPGVLDMKGGIIVVAWAIKALAATVGLDAIAPLRVVIVADEEIGSPEG